MDKNILKKITYGLYIVTSKDSNIESGCIVNTVVQITSEDPVMAVSINKNNYTNTVIKNSKKMGISILSENTNRELINTFGFRSSKDINKFANVEYEIIDNIPIIKENTIGYIIGDVINIIDCNTHDIFLIKVSNSKLEINENPLTYSYYLNNLKGVSPKNAPTYVEEEVKKTTSNKYRCMICGHIYDDEVEKVKFEDLPDDWVCPKCGVSKDKFEKIT